MAVEASSSSSASSQLQQERHSPHCSQSSSSPTSSPQPRQNISGGALSRLAESAEPHLFLRVHEMNRLHRQPRESVSPANGAPERARIAHVHVPVSDYLPVFVDVEPAPLPRPGEHPFASCTDAHCSASCTGR